MRKVWLIIPALLVVQSAFADQVTITGGTVYVTKGDCAQLSAYRPDSDVNYKPGVDARGKYVAPADLPGSDYSNLVPTNGASFNVVVNPMNFAKQNQGQVSTSSQTTTQGKYDNTALPVAHVDVNLKTGETTINGKPLTPQQDAIVRDACRKAGYR